LGSAEPGSYCDRIELRILACFKNRSVVGGRINSEGTSHYAAKDPAQESRHPYAASNFHVGMQVMTDRRISNDL
jgi:hypothetical protein